MKRIPQMLDPAAVKPRKDMDRAEQFLAQQLGAAKAELPAIPVGGGYEAPAGAIPAAAPAGRGQMREVIKAGLADGSIPQDAVVPGFAEGLPAYQQENRNVLGGYLNNPLEEEGRAGIARQFFAAPLGGHLRSAIAGQEVFGHRITGGQARMAEQAAAGALAVGVGLPALMAAANQLNNPQTPGTMPMV